MSVECSLDRYTGPGLLECSEKGLFHHCLSGSHKRCILATWKSTHDCSHRS